MMHPWDLYIKRVASNPGSPFRILSRSFGEKSLRDKIRNGEPGFEANAKVFV